MDKSSILPDGSRFDFWEKPCAWERELIVDGGAANASDQNDGRPEAPLKTINEAARRAGPGARVRIHAGLYRECVRPARGGEGP